MKISLHSQKRGLRLALLVSAMLVVCSFVTVSQSEGNASSFHASAPSQEKKIVRPRHKAATGDTLLAVVNQPDISERHRVLADVTLRSLPAFCRNSLKNFYVLYSDAPENRGLGGANTIIITGNVPDAEFVALLVHECGHVVDLGGVTGIGGVEQSTFFDGVLPMYTDDPSVAFYSISWLNATTKKKGMRSVDFVSGYASTDPFEDFAETFAFYALQNKEFARLAKSNPVLRSKYVFMRDVIFNDISPLSLGSFVRGKKVPWDVTKLPYTWYGS